MAHHVAILRPFAAKFTLHCHLCPASAKLGYFRTPLVYQTPQSPESGAFRGPRVADHDVSADKAELFGASAWLHEFTHAFTSSAGWLHLRVAVSLKSLSIQEDLWNIRH
jgi:hypothetical protein